jgi:hypothetical protein
MSFSDIPKYIKNDPEQQAKREREAREHAKITKLIRNRQKIQSTQKSLIKKQMNSDAYARIAIISIKKNSISSHISLFFSINNRCSRITKQAFPFNSNAHIDACMI